MFTNIPYRKCQQTDERSVKDIGNIYNDKEALSWNYSLADSANKQEDKKPDGKMGINVNKQFIEEEILTVSKNMKITPNLLWTREIRIKPQWDAPCRIISIFAEDVRKEGHAWTGDGAVDGYSPSEEHICQNSARSHTRPVASQSHSQRTSLSGSHIGPCGDMWKDVLCHIWGQLDIGGNLRGHNRWENGMEAYQGRASRSNALDIHTAT